MAKVDVILPPLVKDPEAFLEAMLDFAIPGLDAELSQIVTEVKQGPDMPVHKGHLRQAVNNEPAARQGEKLMAAIVAAGPAKDYADVQDKGRTAGVRSPPYNAIKRWVQLQMKAEVADLALDLQATYKRSHPKKQKGKSRAIGKFRDQAAHLIARGVIRKLERKGMKGRGFIAKRVDEFAERAVRAVEDEFNIYIDRYNATGAT